MKNQENVLITGGTGEIGSQLSVKLLDEGYNVSVFSRYRKKLNPIKVFHWNPEKGEIDTEALIQADYIVHLAGSNIGEKKWTSKRKKDVVSSRVNSACLLLKKIKELNIKPKAYISASAIGYY